MISARPAFFAGLLFASAASAQPAVKLAGHA